MFVILMGLLYPRIGYKFRHEVNWEVGGGWDWELWEFGKPIVACQLITHGRTA